ERIVKLKYAAPDDHPGTGPDCGGGSGHVRGIDCGSCCPTVSGRIVSATCVSRFGRYKIVSPPHDHLVACPYSHVTGSGIRRIENAGGSPSVRVGIVSSTGVVARPAPDDHFRACPDYSVAVSCSGGISDTGG